MDQSQAEAKRIKNIEQGLPARSYFPWDHDEKESLTERYRSGYSFEALANLAERKVSAIVGQLRKLNCISDAEFEEYFPQRSQTTRAGRWIGGSRCGTRGSTVSPVPAWQHGRLPFEWAGLPHTVRAVRLTLNY